jgi:hypothetical protein
MTYAVDPVFGNYSAGGPVCRHCGQLVGLDFGQRTPAGGTWVHDSTRLAECEPVAVLTGFVEEEESKNLRTALLALADQWEALAKESDSDPQTARLAAADEMSRRQAEEIQQIRVLSEQIRVLSEQIRVLSEQIRVLSELEELFGGDDG